MSKEKQSDDVFNNPVLGTFIGVPRDTAGAMLTQEFAVRSPLPCIVILVHGVNDIGDAYETQEQGIVAGLNTRLARTDMHPHQWAEISGLTDLNGAARRVIHSGRSPVIPFYWGYRPVDRETYDNDQQRYRDEVKKLGLESVLPYDAFQENDPKRLKKLNPEMRGFCNDNYGNVLDLAVAKGGGTFANATTCIPDMLGPGANGGAIWMAGVYSRKLNGGDYTHPIYGNPHRIYQFFAAQRLADLILEIRKNPKTELDTINIVAHSQGTIITMLANMLVRQQDPQYAVADCTILCHSPYSLAPRFLENQLPGRQQTAKARQETLCNFCRLMATNPKYDPAGRYHPDFVQAMMNDGTLARKHQWHSDP
ncbi:SGNH/GDSL hydrolase family protein, partial [Pantoea phytobeneficialis]